jgi:hypothetical protein
MNPASRIVPALLFAIALLNPGHSYAQSRPICDQTFDGDIPAMRERISQLPGATIAEGQNPNFIVIITASGHLWNFTKPNHPAHPAIACRRVVKVGEQFHVETHLRCQAAKNRCDKLAADYATLAQKMTETLKKNAPKQ